MPWSTSSIVPWAPSNRMRRPARRSSARPQPNRLGEREDPRCQSPKLGQECCFRDLGDAVAASERVVMQQELVELERQALGVGEIAQADCPAGDLVLVGGADPPASRAELAEALVRALASRLARPIELAVKRQDQGHVLGDPQGIVADREALRAQGLDLVQQGPRIDDDAIADDRELALAARCPRAAATA